MRICRSWKPIHRIALVVGSVALLALAAAPQISLAHAEPAPGFYIQTNLVSNIPGLAKVTDRRLLNPWGIVSSATSPFWISDNNAGVSTLYTGAGTPFPPPPAGPLVVNIPASVSSGEGAAGVPTGVVFNGSGDFVVSAAGKSGAAAFIFATEDGTISGWNPTVDRNNAIRVVDNGPGAVYKGLANASAESGARLFAANFRAGTVDVFNGHFQQITAPGGFRDERIPSGFAPFGIRVIGDKVFVTYAKQNEAKHDDVAGPGNGFVDLFTTSGWLVKRLVSHGALNSPWGLALAPTNFGRFSNALLVGNFGDGHISAYNAHSGAFLGQISGATEAPIVIDGLWGLSFGNGATAGPTTTLFFTAGINGEADGLFGSLTSSVLNK